MTERNVLSVEEKFLKWLSSKVNLSKVSDFYFAYKEIDEYCLKKKIIKKPLFEITDIETISKVKDTVERSRVFKFFHKKNKHISVNAIGYYYRFIKDEQPMVEKVDENSNNIEKKVVVTTDNNINDLNIDDMTQAEKNMISKEVENNTTVKTVDFKNPVSYTYTRPIKYSYFEESYDDFSSWIGMYVSLLNCLIEDYDWIIENLKGKSITSENVRIDIGDERDKGMMTAPKELSNGLYLETNLNASDIMSKVKCFLDLCNVDYENVLILYKSTDFTYEMEINPSQKDIKRLKLYHDILAEKYPKGFRLDSRIDMRKFRYFWEQKYDAELKENDKEVCDNIQQIAIRYQNFAFLPKKMLSEENKAELLTYIDQSFSQGKQAVYYKALYEEVPMVLCESRINNADMLKTYLSYVNEGQYHMGKAYLTKEKGVEFDPLDEVRGYLIQIAMPVKTDKLCEVLSHIPRKKVRFTLSGNKEFIRNAKGEYFHPDVVNISKDELDNISEIISFEIEDKYFISGNELIDAIKIKYPQIFERQPQFSDLAMRDAIGYKLEDKYSFNGNVISEKDKNLSMYDVYAKYCRKRQYITLKELNVLKKALNTIIYFDVVYNNALRISENEFVSKEQANFDVKRIDEAIGKFCSGNYIAIQDINYFGSFPDAGFPWNSYLLEHYVADYSKEFKLLHTNFNANSCVGAIVRNTVDIKDFNALIIDVIANSNIVLDSDTALQYLYDHGFIARRSYKDIEQALVQAKAIREKKG